MNNNSFAAEIKAAIYCRVSSYDQLKDGLTVKSSLQEQERVGRAAVSAAGWGLANIYIEPGISGDKFEERHALQSLLKDAQAGQFHIVIVKVGDRLARDQAIYHHVVKLLQEQSGIQILNLAAPSQIVAPQDFKPRYNPGLIIQHGFSAMMAAYDQALRVERLKTGVDNQIKVGRYLAPKPPFGYSFQKTIKGSKVERIPVPHPETYWIVEKFPQWVLEDNLSTTEIAARLTELGSTLSGGKPWLRGRVYQLLINPFYAGKLAYRRIIKSRTGKSVKNTQPLLADHDFKHPYDWATYLRIMEVLAQRSRVNAAPRNHSTRNPLAGLLRCGHCGFTMRLYQFPSAYYRCNQHAANKYVCRQNTTPGRQLVVNVWQVVVSLAEQETADPDEFYKEFNSEKVALVNPAKELEMRLKTIEKELKGLPEQEAKADQLYFSSEQSINEEKYLSLLAGFQAKKASLYSEEQEVKAKLGKVREQLGKADKMQGYLATVKALDAAVKKDLPLLKWDPELLRAVRQIFKGIFSKIKVKSVQDPVTKNWTIDLEIEAI